MCRVLGKHFSRRVPTRPLCSQSPVGAALQKGVGRGHHGLQSHGELAFKGIARHAARKVQQGIVTDLRNEAVGNAPMSLDEGIEATEDGRCAANRDPVGVPTPRRAAREFSTFHVSTNEWQEKSLGQVLEQRRIFAIEIRRDAPAHQSLTED
jgi:hypothetical protein